MEELIKEFLDKKVIDALSSLLSSKDDGEINNAAVTVAESFGAGEFKLSSDSEQKKLLSSFKKNLSLLVEKTWVEKRDVSVKEEILYKLEQYCVAVGNNEWSKSYLTFLKILTDVMYLMFGTQTKTEDFGAYALRIDPEFGIFCWYVRSLPETNDWSESKNKAVQNIAMFFLANY